jgi:hypothetical protein
MGLAVVVTTAKVLSVLVAVVVVVVAVVVVAVAAFRVELPTHSPHSGCGYRAFLRAPAVESGATVERRQRSVSISCDFCCRGALA